MTSRIGIGISDFQQLRGQDLLFVDKSPLIGEVLDSAARVILLPRPRRFGKTQNLSMLRYFFERSEEDRAPLFQGLAIEANEHFRVHQGRYPVIFLIFKDVKTRTWRDTGLLVRLLIAEEFSRHEALLPHLRARDAAYFERILSEEAPLTLYETALQRLSAWLHEHWGEPVVILIDEYDTPVHAAWQHGYYGELMDFMRGLLGGAFKDNLHAFKCVVTGILRLAIISDGKKVWVQTV